MTARVLLKRLNNFPDEFLDMDIKVLTNNGTYDIWHTDLGGCLYCIEDNVKENPAELRKKLRKARKKAKRWKRKYLELRYELDKVESEEV